MKFTRLILSNLFRKKLRLMFTLVSFTVALFLFGFLAVVKEAFGRGMNDSSASLLIVINRTSMIQPLPVSYRERILRIPGVQQVTHNNWFSGVYQDERNFFPKFAIDTDHWREVYPDIVIPPDQWANFKKDRQGAIVGASTAKRFGWKVGDRIPLQGTFLPGTWEFNIDGIYHSMHKGDDETQFWFRWDYMDERMPDPQKGITGWFVVRIQNPDDATRIARVIDDGFSNSPYETRTSTEKTFLAGIMKQWGNIEFLITTVGTIVFFTLLLVTGNTMAIAVRERTRELAVLKAVGFSDGAVLALVLAESLVVAMVGGILGLALAKLFTLGGNPTSGVLPSFYLPARAVIWGLAAAVLVGAVSGLLPAIGAMRLRVVDALRRI